MFLDWASVETTQVKKCLEYCKDLFQTQKNWVFHPSAVDNSGFEVDPQDKNAIGWNLIGATERYARTNYEQPLADCIASATREYLQELALGTDGFKYSSLEYLDELKLINLGLEEIINYE